MLGLMRNGSASAPRCGWCVRSTSPSKLGRSPGLTTGSAYSIIDDTVSDLGALGRWYVYSSPAHALMNATFGGVGLLLAGGALLLALRTVYSVAALLVVSGVSSVATGLAPVDVDPGAARRGRHPALRSVSPSPCSCSRGSCGRRTVVQRPALLATSVVATGTAAIGFIASGDSGAGAWERLALWPVIVALAAAAPAVADVRRPVRAGTASAGHR